VIPSAAPPHPPGAVWLEPGDDGLVLHLQGEVDSATVARWDRERPSAAADGVPQGAVVAVDASAAAFLNSTGVALLVRETESHRRPAGAPSCAAPRGRCCRCCA
jgi:anti-anti-sigma regulatory factor